MTRTAELQWVIFDLDGTLIESEEIWRDVRHEFVIAHGGKWNESAQTDMIGMTTEEWSRYIHDDLGVSLAPDEIAKEVASDVVARLSTAIPILPGAAGALERLASTFRLGLATSATLIVAQTVLARTGWDKFFSVVVSADSVARGKPAPDVYLRAIELLKADPARTVAVEDSTNGIRSAHAAGLAVVAIPNRTFRPDRDALSLAACILTSLDELDSNTIRDALRGRSLTH